MIQIDYDGINIKISNKKTEVSVTLTSQDGSTYHGVTVDLFKGPGRTRALSVKHGEGETPEDATHLRNLEEIVSV